MGYSLAQITMLSSTIHADEGAIVNRGPLRLSGPTVEAGGVVSFEHELLENQIGHDIFVLHHL